MNVRAFRKNHRKGTFSFISGWTHLGVVVGGSLLISIIPLLFISNLIWLELLILPVTLIIANFVEYWIHRWPMHKVMPLLKKMYKTHSGKHHRYFTHEFMNMECDEDLHEVFATPLTVSSFFFGVVMPISVLCSLFLSINVGLLFFATCMSYYGLYEFIHFASHLPPYHILSKLPLIVRAREHHKIHHNTRLMREWNFNIGLPLMDYLFGTIKKESHFDSECSELH